jgi:hypothetical protein
MSHCGLRPECQILAQNASNAPHGLIDERTTRFSATLLYLDLLTELRAHHRIHLLSRSVLDMFRREENQPACALKLACILLPHDFLVRARLFACHNFQCSIGSMRPRWQCMSNCHPYRDNECVLRFIMTDHINDPNVDSPGTYFFNSKGRVVKRTIYRHVKALEMDRGS